ncbi:M14 family metallopeptidase [Pseudoalteromonas sp. BDTF-M6]|uniref:M14 family metallopeptidase n=1 Tax=Pseudoalteromonas sp. BDTF-M6 TaxID=2796132 RepID=UPI001BB04EA4|nr:M14 family metallopeptidase [Pseudoalteromonas sp. BDTF-M6]MBS3796657.1 peptidase M14 [Pseudoalteromonas sp. BDTF-M6]
MLTSLLLSAALSQDAHLPPLISWHGDSEVLMQSDGPLQTDFERSGGVDSPNYENTMAYLAQLVKANSAQFHTVTIGKSDAGRDIRMLIATEHGLSSAEQLVADNKPTLLIQAGIHSGEIDGKDAGFMLLRDIAKGHRPDILKSVNLLFIPILNVDGHERRSAFNRINQRGPNIMGFRTNGQNLNLNRDYTKLDTPGIRAIAHVVNTYQPDLYIDVHVTDGADYQYDITYGYNPSFASSTPKVTQALDKWVAPVIDAKLQKQGHIPGPLVFVMDKMEFSKGLAGWVAGPRYSNGWGELRHLPTILVENHSLKPYKQRVLGTYVLLDGAIEALATHGEQIDKAVADSINTSYKELVVARDYASEPDSISFKGIAYEHYTSAVTGSREVRYLGEAQEYESLPIYWQKEVKTKVAIPKAFYIPRQYAETLTVLSLQGVKLEAVSEPLTLALRQAQITSYEFAKAPFEGRFRVTPELEYTQVNVRLDNNWVKVDTDQKLGLLATHILHPDAPDSLLQWGFFHTLFQRTEYVENYALAPYAAQLLASDEEIRVKFEQKLKDPSFAQDAEARRAWLYQQSPYYDQQYLNYPVLMQYENE